MVTKRVLFNLRSVRGALAVGALVAVAACQMNKQPLAPTSLEGGASVGTFDATAAGASGGMDLRAPKMDICHHDEEGFRLISISANAELAHRGHGDAAPGEGVPGLPGATFSATCEVVAAAPAVPLACPCWNTYSEPELVSVLDAVTAGDWSFSDAGTFVLGLGGGGATAGLAASAAGSCYTYIAGIVDPTYAVSPLSEVETQACLAEARAIFPQVRSNLAP